MGFFIGNGPKLQRAFETRPFPPLSQGIKTEKTSRFLEDNPFFTLKLHRRVYHTPNGGIMDITTLSTGPVLLVAGLHFWFMALEMYFWQRTLGLKTFRMTPEQARATATLAGNQGLYNGILAAGLIFALLTAHTPMLVFLLLAISIAGLYGGWSVHRKIFYVQSIPALLALITLYFA